MSEINSFNFNDDKKTMDEYIQFYQKNKNKIILIDVRKPDEYAQGHIDGSTNIPLSSINDLKEFYPDLNANYFVYCRSGNRSENAKKIMLSNGYKNVINIGGIMNFTGKTVQ